MALIKQPKEQRADMQPIAKAWQAIVPGTLRANDYACFERLAKAHTVPEVVGLLRWYKAAQARGAYVPQLYRPSQLGQRWAQLVVAQALDVEPTVGDQVLYQQLAACGWPVSDTALLYGVAHSTANYKAYSKALAAYSGPWEGLARHACCHLQSPPCHVAAWYTGYHAARGGRPWCPIQCQWAATHPYALQQGNQLAQAYCGYGGAWGKLLKGCGLAG